MRADNLGRWVDELAASIEDLEKKVNRLEVEPVPVPTDEYKMECSLLLTASVSTEEQTVITGQDLGDLTGYDFILVTLESVADGVTGETLCPGSLFEASKVFQISTPGLYMNDPESGYQNYAALKFFWEQVNVEGELVDYLTFTPMLLETTGTRTAKIYGLKIERVVEARTGFIKKAANAVKRILRKEDK